MDDPQGKQLKGYQLEERIGDGGFGVVYRAKQTTIEREVAVKIILPKYANNPDFVRRFEIEAQLIARLEHPHITPLIDYWRNPNGAYLVMRYLRGGSVREMLMKSRLELLRISGLVDQLASALDFAHRNHVIHRDIKPANILLDEDGNGYLADFGIAKDLKGVVDGKTAVDSVIGSLDYISPEQARSEPVTSKTDIYSLGVTLYEMITGEHPYKDASAVERLYKHINEPLPEITNLPDGLQDTVNEIIQRATAKDPAQRYPHIMALAIAFRQSIAEEDKKQSDSVVELLTLREQETLSYIISGMSNREIADKMTVTLSTVKWHISQLYKKLEVRSRVQAIVRARELNLVIDGFNQQITSQATKIADISLPEPDNPYKGLYAFQTTDAQDFFGRQDLTDLLIKRMTSTDAYRRFLAVVGPSGSGKSSLVKAGLIPALWKGAIRNSEKWFVVDMIPGTHPMDKLETALIRVATHQSGNLREQLTRDERGLLRVADIILPGDDTELVIVVDQFEEVFTLVESEIIRQKFLDLLRAAVSDVRSRVRVIVTLRADYYDRPLHYPDFGALIRAQMETILPLSAMGLERAIRGPAERVGVTFEQGLVEQIISEVNYQSGALPLLQYALTELFDRRVGRLLTNDAYQKIGGAVGALANRADDIYEGLTTEAQVLTQQMLMRMVTLGEGAEDTRRRVLHAELLSLSKQTDLIEEIIDQFAAYRLFSLDHDPETRQPTVEVAHEAILREWERLRLWLNESRDDIRLQQQLSYVTSDWRNANQDNSFLLRGTRLEQFSKWVKETPFTLTQQEHAFVEASVKQREKEQREEQARQQRELAQERRARVLLRSLVAVFALATVLSSGFGVFAFIQRNNAVEAQNMIADEQARTLEALDIAQRSGLAFAADAALEVRETDLAIALALESIGDSETNLLPETQRILQRLSESGGPRQSYISDVGCASILSYGYTYRLLVNCSSGNWTVIDLRNMTEVIRDTAPTETGLIMADISSDGQYIFSSSTPFGERPLEVDIWDGQTLDKLASIEINNPMLSLEFSADSSMLVSFETTEASFQALEDGVYENFIGQTVVLRDVNTGAIVKEYDFSSTDAYLYAVGFSPDGTMGVVSGWAESTDSGTYRIIVFDTETGEIKQTFDRPELQHSEEDVLGARPVGFSADSQIVWLGGYPNYAIDIATGENYGYLHEMSELDRIYLRGPSPDFKYIGVRSGENRILFNIENGEETPYQEFAAILPSAISDVVLPTLHGRFNEYLLWDINGRDSQINFIETEGNYPHVSYSPDGSRMGVVTGYWRNTQNSQSMVLDSETLDEVFRLDTNLNIPFEWSWSADGNYIATTTATEGIIIWDANTGEELHRLQEEDQEFIMQAVFTPDNRYLVSAVGTMYVFDFEISPIPEILLWDTETWSITKRIPLPFDESAPMYGIIDMAIHPHLPLVAVTVSHSLVTENASTAVDSDTHSYIVNYETNDYQEVVPDGVFVIGNLKFTPDGNYLVAAEFTDDDIYVVDVQSGDIVNQWASPDNGTIGLDISPDSRYVVTGSGTIAFESNASLWDIQTGQLLQRYKGHLRGSHLMDVTFHPDGQSLATTAIDGDIYTYEFSPQSALDWIRENRVVRDLTCAEREQYRINPPCDE